MVAISGREGKECVNDMVKLSLSEESEGMVMGIWAVGGVGGVGGVGEFELWATVGPLA